MNNVIINKLNGGLGRREPLTDMVSGIAIGVEDADIGIDFGVGEHVTLTSLEDAISHGITSEVDANEGYHVFSHIKEFFRMNKNGDLKVVFFNRAVESQDLMDPAEGASSVIRTFLAENAGKINQLAIAFNPLAVEEIAGPIDILTVQKAQLLAEHEIQQNRPIHIVLGAIGTISTTLADTINLRELNCQNVSVMIGQAFAAPLEDETNAIKYAANVGTLLGAISLAKVNESVSWVRKFNLEGDGINKPYIGGSPVFPNRTLAQIEDFNSKGYIFFVQHVGITGVYFNDSHCAVPLTSDFAYIENNRTINKASRLIRTALLPYLNSPIAVDPITGKLSPVIVKEIQEVGNKAINEQMLKAGELSGFTFLIDENQNILSTSNLDTELTLIPTGTARQITVNIGFSNPFNS